MNTEKTDKALALCLNDLGLAVANLQITVAELERQHAGDADFDVEARKALSASIDNLEAFRAALHPVDDATGELFPKDPCAAR